MEVMDAIMLKSVADAVAKKLASLVSLPKTLFKTWFRIQLNIMCFPFRLVPAVIRIASLKKDSQQVDVSAASDEHCTQPKEACAPDPREHLEPSSEEVVNKVKKLRNCVAMSIDVFTGRDFFWDVPILDEKVRRYKRALFNDDPVELAAAKKALKEHPVIHPRPKSKEEYNRLMEEARGGPGRVVDADPKQPENTRPVINRTPLHRDAERNFDSEASVSNVLKPKKKVVFRLDNEEPSTTKQETRNAECQHNKRLSLQNRRLRNQLMTTNSRLEELLKCSNGLLQEVSKLNAHFNKLTNMNSKITTLENEIGEGKKLLHDLEEERNDLRHKLLTLEQLIKEEESYLDDLSCESGFEEIENVCDSHDDEL